MKDKNKLENEAVRLLINDYCKKYKKEDYSYLRGYLNTIRFTIEDYTDEGINMSMERDIYLGLEAVLEKRNKRNQEDQIEDGFNVY